MNGLGKKPPARSRHVGVDVKPQKESRRRGEILEDAILLAAWEELSAVGYTHLTMEGVAARAKTSKAVMYRRWPNKGNLIVAALHKYSLKKYLPLLSNEAPNTGNLREDVLILLGRVTKPLQEIGAETIHGLLVDFLDKETVSSLPRILQSQGNDRMISAMRMILEHAEKRGEIHVEKINPRIISLPMDLIRYEIIIRHEPISDATLNEIIDDIFLPLIHE
jgi:AcrR family transcriptional regulator